MIRFLRKHRRALFIATATTFLIGIFVGLGGYLFTSRDVSESVATVGSAKIPYNRFLAKVNQYAEAVRQQGTDLSDVSLKEIKQGMLREMIIEEILAKKADELGVTVTDAELARDIRNTPAFQRGGVFSEELYFAAVRNVFHDTHGAFEDSRRRAIKTAKLKQLFLQVAKLTPAEIREAYAQEKKGVMKDFEKEREQFEWKAQQQRAIELLNYYLRQASTQVEIRTYLDQRESGT
ncbi:MAG: SurA N-terminal domain-containing protein [Elusimicrobia bacterium]|nr:SurA N-terminal domain-containing protein [Elusimicrobiota bacterium]